MIKYLIVESIDLIDPLIVRIGITLIRLTSNPIQAVAHEEEDTTIKVLVTVIVMKL